MRGHRIKIKKQSHRTPALPPSPPFSDPPVPVSTENSQGSRRGKDEPVEAGEEVALLNSQLSSITIVLSNYELPLVSYQRAT